MVIFLNCTRFLLSFLSAFLLFPSFFLSFSLSLSRACTFLKLLIEPTKSSRRQLSQDPRKSFLGSTINPDAIHSSESIYARAVNASSVMYERTPYNRGFPSARGDTRQILTSRRIFNARPQFRPRNLRSGGSAALAFESARSSSSRESAGREGEGPETWNSRTRPSVIAGATLTRDTRLSTWWSWSTNRERAGRFARNEHAAHASAHGVHAL